MISKYLMLCVRILTSLSFREETKDTSIAILDAASKDESSKKSKIIDQKATKIQKQADDHDEHKIGTQVDDGLSTKKRRQFIS